MKERQTCTTEDLKNFCMEHGIVEMCSMIFQNADRISDSMKNKCQVVLVETEHLCWMVDYESLVEPEISTKTIDILVRKNGVSSCFCVTEELVNGNPDYIKSTVGKLVNAN